MRMRIPLMAAVVTAMLFVTPAAAAYDNGGDTSPEKIKKVECSSMIDVKCSATNLDIQIRNNLIEILESNRGLADDWDEKGQKWQESNFETKQDLGEYFSERAEGAHNRIDFEQERLRNNTIPEIIL